MALAPSFTASAQDGGLLASSAAAQEPSAPARSRPLYERVLGLYEQLSLPDQTRAAQVELRTLLDGWGAHEFGFAQGVEPDMVLASVAALAVLPRDPERTDELLVLLDDVEAELHAAAQPAADLALALARGWLAAAAVPRPELEDEELAEHLAVALHFCAAIDQRDQRDGFGSQIALELYPRLRAAGRAREASASLALALELFPSDLDSRPQLLCLLADERRVASDWNAWTSLQQAEQVFERLKARDPGQAHAQLERILASVHCQLELACGLLDRAVQSLARERAAVAAGASDPESRFDLLLNVAGVALACAQPVMLNSALAELEAGLAAAGQAPAEAGYRAAVRARRAVLQYMCEELTPVAAPRAPALLASAQADPALDESHRTTLALKRVQSALLGHDLTLATRLLEELDAHTKDVAARAPELEAALIANRALLALARGAEREELQRHFDAVELAYQRFLGAWRASPQREGGFGFHSWRSRRLLAGVLIDLCLTLDGPSGAQRAIELVLPEQALGSLARRLDCKPGSLAEVRSTLLAPGIGLLLYLPGWARTHLFCIDAQKIVSFKLPWRYESEPLPRELANQLSASPARLSASARAAERKEFERRAGALAQALLPPEVEQLLATWRGVYVVGADMLGDIPFECLPVGGEALGTRTALAYLPSLSVGLELARRAAAEREPRGRGLLLVAAPENAAFEPIAFGKAEQVALSAGFERVRLLSGRDANRTALFERLKADEPALLHFLVHGWSNAEREFSGALALAPCAADPDGLLWGDEILSADFVSPPLVLLSACGSAHGPRRAGDDGLAQLGGAFFSHGARCMIETADDIALAPTLRLMAAFTRAFSAGRSPAEALLDARRELSREPDFAHPFYALSMRVVGLGFESGAARSR